MGTSRRATDPWRFGSFMRPSRAERNHTSCGLTQAAALSPYRLRHPVSLPMAGLAGGELDMIHQFIRNREMTACGLTRHDAHGTHICSGVTCPECREVIEKMVDRIFEPLDGIGKYDRATHSIIKP